MARETEKYKRSFAGSVGAGMGSLFNAAGKTYYILEHKVSSKYHKAGESQKIIINQIELGRDPSCQIRFDESFGTVSRKHAAIVKEGENYKLVQLSSTNTTFLNGRPLQKEWYLQSGDEIQLSVNGPKMGFIIPQGKQSLVSSINFTERFSLFRQQALRPYKQAIMMLSIFFFLCVCGGGYALYNQGTKITEQGHTISGQQIQIDSLEQVAEANIAELAKVNAKAKEIQDGLNKKIKQLQGQVATIHKSANPVPPISELKKLTKDVYWIQVYKVEMTYKGQTVVIPDYSWIATGFLLDDGRFVTARHCIEAWRYPEDEEGINRCLLEGHLGAKIKAYINAYSNDGNVFHFTSDQFKISDSKDYKDIIEYQKNDGTTVRIPFQIASDDSPDCAYVNTNKKGDLKQDSELSKNLQQQEAVYILGYPHGYGAGTDVERQEDLQPSYSESVVARSGLTAEGCIQLSNKGFEQGNSGGPVFVLKDGEYKVIAIVSAGRESIGFVTPICRIN
jgi:hypothetical protein